MHKHGIAHGDVGPHSVFVNDHWSAVVNDFGTARVVVCSLPMLRVVEGVGVRTKANRESCEKSSRLDRSEIDWSRRSRGRATTLSRCQFAGSLCVDPLCLVDGT